MPSKSEFGPVEMPRPEAKQCQDRQAYLVIGAYHRRRCGLGHTDWEQLQNIAAATYALHQPLAGRSAYADPTYPEPKDDAIPVFDLHQLPSAESPTNSLSGDHWDLL